MAREDAEAARGEARESMLSAQSKGRRDAGVILEHLKKKRIPILALLVITILSITIIALAAKQTSPCPSCLPSVAAACPDGWAGFQGKCFYFSETEGNWSVSQNHCASLNASLATVDSLPELAFMLRYKGIPFCWIGLRREQDQGQPWKWTNGTIFSNLFRVRGERQCAYLDDREVSSARCYVEMHFICSRPDECSRRKLSAARGDTVSKIT
ncbi:C-type lectin domain family 2 member D-like isoform X2 [Pelodiscus sinensis]